MQHYVISLKMLLLISSSEIDIFMHDFCFWLLRYRIWDLGWCVPNVVDSGC